MSLSRTIRQAVPSVDEVVASYAVGYVNNIEKIVSDPAGAQTIHLSAEIGFIGELLKSAGASDEAIVDLSSSLSKTLGEIYEKNLNKTSNAAFRKLDKDVLSSAQKSNAMRLSDDVVNESIDMDLLASNRKVESRVDKKKLEKAERKIAAKLAKREKGFMKELEYERSKLLDENSTKDYDDFFLTVNPIDLGPSLGKTKDIKIENFDLHLPDGRRILSDATLTLSYGHTYGVVGSNGIGKSTLLKALSRRELPVPKHITILYVEQEVVGDETTVLQTVLDADVWRKYLLKDQERIQNRLSSISQERAELEDADALAKQLDEESDDLESNLNDVYEKLNEIESDKAEARAAEILNGLGFSLDAQQRATNTFSGGWRMRLSLARALFCKPDLLMLDEPSNMLDLPSLTYLSDYLQGYPSTVLVVSHDRTFLNDIATDIIHQHSERLDYYRGQNFDQFYSTKEERFKTLKREYESQMAQRQHMQSFVDRFRYNAARAQEAQSRLKKLEKMPILEAPVEEAEFSFKFPEPEQLSAPILMMEDVSFKYTPDAPRNILSDVDLSVQMDSRIALVGGNGSGKSTAIKLLTEKIKPTKGFVTTNSRLRIAYFAQHHVDGMDLNLSAVEWMAKLSPGKSDQEYRRLLGAFGITGALGLQKLGTMSGGQKSRVAFACLGLSNPHILVLDEPSNHLDIAGLDALADALKSFKGGIIMVSHDVTTIKRVCNEIWVCEEGRIYKSQGSIEDYKKHILKKASGAGVVNQH